MSRGRRKAQAQGKNDTGGVEVAGIQNIAAILFRQGVYGYSTRKTAEINNRQKKDIKSTRKEIINISIKNKDSGHVMSCANPSASIHVKAK
jgi:hypothetical protein